MVLLILIGLVTLTIESLLRDMYSLLVQEPITWSCKKQSAISLSSVESEYRGAVEANKEAMWLRQILSDFGLHQQHPTTLWCDNQSAIQLCKAPLQH